MYLRAQHALIAICGTLVLSWPVKAGQELQAPYRLTLRDAIRIAIEQNPTIQAARNEIEMAEADAVTATKRLNPAFTFEMENYPYFRSNPGPFFSAQEFTTRFDYEIETRDRRRLRTDAARRQVEVQNLLLEDRIRQLRLKVQRAYFQVVLAKSNLAVAHSVIEQTDRVLTLNRVRFDQGDISRLELKRIEVERLRFLNDVFQAELALRNAKSTLLSLLNAQDLAQDVEVAQSLSVQDVSSEPGLPPSVPLVELERIAMKRRPDFLAAVAERRRSDSQTRLQRAIRSPNVTVGGGYKRNGPDNSLIFGITIPIKIFDRNEGGILRADAERRRAGNLAAAVRKRIELDIQTAFNAVEINQERVRYIEIEHLRKAEDTRTVTLAAYQLGGATLMDYLDVQRSYRDTVRIYNQALYDKRISLYQLANAIGIGDQ